MRTLYIVRHGQTEWNLAQRMQGRLDSPLTELGRRQADVHGRTLARLGPVDELIASPLGRTRETARLVNDHLGAAVRFHAALMERDCGDWSGLTLAEIEAAYPDSWAARARDPYGHRPPGGENHDDMERRVRDLLTELRAQGGDRVALVTHGVMSRVIIKHLLNLVPADAAVVRHPNELFYRLEFTGARQAGESSYFVLGQGPQRGLLRQNDSETIGGPNSNDTVRGSEHES